MIVAVDTVRSYLANHPEQLDYIIFDTFLKVDYDLYTGYLKLAP